MIAPMKKIAIVMLGKDADSAPRKLRRLGIVHLEKYEGCGGEFDTLKESLARARRAEGIISDACRDGEKGKKTRKADAGKVQAGAADPGTIVSDAIGMDGEIQRCREEIILLVNEIRRVEGWGDFEPGAIPPLSREGIRIRLVECSPRDLKDIPEDIEYIRLASPKGKARIAVVGEADLPSSLREFRIPGERLASLLEKRASLEGMISERRKALAAMGKDLPAVAAHIGRLESSLTLERLRSGMPQEEDLRYLMGYVPGKDVDRIKAEAAGQGWAIAVDDPSGEDLPPTKMENPRFVRMIEPVMNFLGTVPNYREYDISLSFLLFFSIFFAMIFGDGGYGVLILLLAAFMAFKARMGKKPLSDFNRLMFLLGGTTMLWGFATTTWFAIPFDSLPRVLQVLSVGALNGANPDAETNVKVLCFILGACQLAFAHAKNIRKNFPSLTFLAQVGSLCLVIGMFSLVLNLVVDPQRFPVPQYAIFLIGGGFLLVFVFGNWNGRLISSILESLKSIIPTFLGTVSVFADIVSYIRLWAVGLAGLAISQTVNSMASQIMSPVAGQILVFIVKGVVGVALLFAGHSLNLVMNLLSVIVHGMRLNILEYSSHLGMEWSGYKYEPLSEKAEIDIQE